MDQFCRAEAKDMCVWELRMTLSVPRLKLTMNQSINGVQATIGYTRSHNGVNPSLLDHGLKRLKVHLPKCPLVHFGRDGHPFKLRIVADEVFGARGDALGLQAADVPHSQPRRQIWVLREACTEMQKDAQSIDVKLKCI